METKNTTTKDRILDAAIELYAANGYAETSLREIAASVGIKVSSIYNHFSSKEEILNAMFDEYSNWYYSAMPSLDVVDAFIKTADGDSLTSEALYHLLFFIYPEEKDARYRKIVKVLYYESINFKNIDDFMEYESVESSVVFIRQTLDKMIEAGLLQPMDTSAVSSLLISIQSAYISLTAMGLNSMDRTSGGNKTMFDLLNYTLDLVIQGKTP